MSLVFVFTFLVGVAGHGLMTLPIPRTDSAPSTLEKAVIFGGYGGTFWYTNNIDPNAPPNGPRITIPGTSFTQFCARGGKQPWCAPGTAPILSSCGVKGGGPPCGVTGAGQCGTKGLNTDGRDLPTSPRGNQLPGAETENVWKRGGVAKVAWAVQANHGGGYAWRLCPANAHLTEECFQENHLEFASRKAVVRWVNCEPEQGCIHSGEEMVIDADIVSRNTFPAGSQWARLPFRPDYPDQEQCPHCQTCPGKGPRGSWQASQGCYKLSTHNFSMIDLVKVPASLPLGKYVLSWRWDSRVNPQVWTNCADIEIADEATPVTWVEPVPGAVQAKLVTKNGKSGTGIDPTGADDPNGAVTGVDDPTGVDDLTDVDDPNGAGTGVDPTGVDGPNGTGAGVDAPTGIDDLKALLSVASRKAASSLFTLSVVALSTLGVLAGMQN